MVSAGLGFTGRQKLLLFLRLQNTGNISVRLPTAKSLQKWDIKSPKQKQQPKQTNPKDHKPTKKTLQHLKCWKYYFMKFFTSSILKAFPEDRH